MNKELFIKEVEKLGIKLTEKQLNQLEIYCNYLIENLLLEEALYHQHQNV